MASTAPTIVPRLGGTERTLFSIASVSIKDGGGFVEFRDEADSAFVGATGSDFSITGSAGSPRPLYFETAGETRWRITASADAESGGDTGSNFHIERYDDDGSLLDVPILINRETGAITLTGNVSADGYQIRAESYRTDAVLFKDDAGILKIRNVGDTAYKELEAYNIILSQPAGTIHGISLKTDESTRWLLMQNGDAESGGNVGSNLELRGYADNGSTLLNTPITINRASGLITLGVNLTADGFQIRASSFRTENILVIETGGVLAVRNLANSGDESLTVNTLVASGHVQADYFNYVSQAVPSVASIQFVSSSVPRMIGYHASDSGFNLYSPNVFFNKSGTSTITGTSLTDVTATARTGFSADIPKGHWAAGSIGAFDIVGEVSKPGAGRLELEVRTDTTQVYLSDTTTTATVGTRMFRWRVYVQCLATSGSNNFKFLDILDLNGGVFESRGGPGLATVTLTGGGSHNWEIRMRFTAVGSGETMTIHIATFSFVG